MACPYLQIFNDVIFSNLNVSFSRQQCPLTCPAGPKGPQGLQGVKVNSLPLFQVALKELALFI